MEDPKTTIKLRCLFCMSEQFVFPAEDYEPKPGDLIQCANCGRQNDYDSLLRVMKKRAEEWAKEETEKVMKKAANDFEQQLKRMFR